MLTFRCDGLCKSFDGIRALSDVSLELPAAGITAIVGPNGAGKTTLFNVLTGFVRADAGKCFLGDRETTRLAAHKIAQQGVARTFQDLRLIFEMPVVENVILARPAQKGESLLGALLRIGHESEEARNREDAVTLLRIMGLEDRALALAGELSYGEQKLLTLACCLATEAHVLLLDEPVAGIHPAMASRLLKLLRQVCNEGKVVVFIEHDIDAVRQVADHVFVMDEGKVIANGSPRDILAQPEIVEAYLG